MRANQKISGLKVAYIGGGSRGWAWGFMKDLALDGEMEGEVRLYDIDRDAALCNKRIAERINAHPAAVSRWSYTVADSLKAALRGADFVVISILPGTLREMHSDVHEPEKYGIYQSVGDTAGPGGLVRALRTIPMYADIARAIGEHCPGAWVINYTNPMALCVRTLCEVFPGVKAFGCCHEVFGTQSLLCDMLGDQCGIGGVDRTQIKTNVLGVNHFTWFDRASYRDMDLMPIFRAFADRYYETGYGAYHEENWMSWAVFCTHRVKFDLFKRHGLIAAAGDRHLAEFLPPWYLKDPETAARWGFSLTPVDRRAEEYERKNALARRLANGEEPASLTGSGEEGHLLIKAILGLHDQVSNVNLPNRGQIANLPIGAIVETNALFRRDSVSPVFAGALAQDVLALVMPHAINQRLILLAAMSCDYDLALNALLNEPLVRLSPDAADKLLGAMLENTKAYLPAGWKL